MKRTVEDALARAWSVSWQDPAPSMQSFLDHSAQELVHSGIISVGELAIVASGYDGMPRTGVASKGSNLPQSTLLALVEETGRSGVPYQILNHTNDTIRFVQPALRQSVIVSLPAARELIPSERAFAWFGITGKRVVTTDLLDQIQDFAAQIGAWLDRYGPLVRMWLDQVEDRRSVAEREREMALLAHDARAPLGSIKYAISLISEEKTLTREELEAALAELSYLERLMECFSVRARGDEELDYSRTEVSPICRQVVQRFYGAARLRGIALTFNEPQISLQVECSAIDLERIISNIVSNAIRHTVDGFVRVGLSLVAGRAHIEIADSGAGMEQSLVDELMDPMTITLSRRSGWGIGLLSTRDRLKELGGGFEVSSALRRGTVVAITVPVASTVRLSTGLPNHNLAATSTGTVTSDRGDVLLVDDDPEHSLSLARVLRATGITVKTAQNIEEAMKEIVSGTTPTVLCDVHMPDGGAEQLLHKLREHRLEVRVGVMSGEEDEGLLYKFAAQGAEAFFSKPTEPSQLVDWIRGNASSRREIDRV